MQEKKRVAVLIDADNAPAVWADRLMQSAEGYGSIVTREVFGGVAALNAWTAAIYRLLMDLRVTLSPIKGKNSTDIVITMRLMELLYEDVADVIVIVSSDSDFAAPAARLRRAGRTVIGMGSRAANEAWRGACDGFIDLSEAEQDTEAPREPGDKRTIAEAAEALLRDREDGMLLGEFCSRIGDLPAYREGRSASGHGKAGAFLRSVLPEAFVIESVDGVDRIRMHRPAPEEPVEITAQPATEDADAAEVAAIMKAARRPLDALNGLRSRFGDRRGREYYHAAKQLLGGK